MAKGKKIVRKDVRVHEDPVTHELIAVDLDAARLAFERIAAAIDTELKRLKTNPERYKAVDLVAELLVEKQPHSEEAA